MTGLIVILASCAVLTTAVASGCSEFSSKLAAIAKTLFLLPTTLVTCGLPTVIVPVLSNTTVSMSLTSSRTSPFLIKTPILALRAVPTIKAVGVAKPSAHGQAITTTETAKSIALTNVAPKKTYQITKVIIAIIKTTGTKILDILSVRF